MGWTNDEFRKRVQGAQRFIDSGDESLRRLLERKGITPEPMPHPDPDVVEVEIDTEELENERHAAVQVLVSPMMGLKRKEAERLVKSAAKKLGTKYSCEDLVQLILKTRT